MFNLLPSTSVQAYKKSYTTRKVLKTIIIEIVEKSGVTGVNASEVRAILKKDYPDVKWKFTSPACVLDQLRSSEQIKCKYDDNNCIIERKNEDDNNEWVVVYNPDYDPEKDKARKALLKEKKNVITSIFNNVKRGNLELVANQEHKDKFIKALEKAIEKLGIPAVNELL